MRFIKIFSFLILILLFPTILMGQETAVVFGKVTDSRHKPLDLVNISVMGYSGGNISDKDGEFEITVPANKQITVVFSFVGFNSMKSLITLSPGDRMELNKIMTVSTIVLPDVVVEDKQVRATTLNRIDPKEATFIPSISGSSVESLIKTMPGVAATNELSSQYSVRGGNYDENLVYVNDIEIYRPFLIRASQQEGLSFVNSDLVSSISFSAGGFDAKYGDKMSSVLDIKYKSPTRFAGSFSASLLGAAFHVEGVIPNHRLSYLLGVRYKSNQYVLKSLETKGIYNPSFTDVQGLITYEFNDKLKLSFLGYFAGNSYKMEPETRETAFGAINEAYKFTVYFDGREQDRFMNFLGGLTLNYKLKNTVDLKFITSAFRTVETENFDILGQYWISRLETDWSDDEFGQPTEVLGVGTNLNHARNELEATVYNIEHRGTAGKRDHYIQWSIKYQYEMINDDISEWDLLDSADYSLPHPPDSLGYTVPGLQPQYPFELFHVIKASNEMLSNRYTAFIQDNWSLIDTDSNSLMITGGVRFQYWDYNRQFLVSPRFTVAYKPPWEKDIVFRLSTGYYYQPPFYRELRNPQGELNPDLKAQQSIHFVAGADWNFMAWGRPFKFVAEAYYKHLDNLVPYVIDNVRIIYYAENISHGFATGLDMKVNGEFVKGVESWASLSLLKTMEDIENDFYYDSEGNLVEPGYLRRPTDQRLNFGLYFQDYLPKNPTYRMHLSFLYGTNLPFGPPDQPKYTHVFKSSPYLRVDLGFSKQLIGKGTPFSPKNPLRHFEAMWISLEVFNLLQHLNTVSYIWVRTINNLQYPVPNRLTPRQINLKLVIDF